MSGSRRHGYAVAPGNGYAVKPPSYVPEFKTAVKFAEKKIDMLEKDFKIKLTDKQKLHLKYSSQRRSSCKIPH